MSRAVFAPASVEKAEPADYYLHKKENSIWWKVRGAWYRMFTDGSCGQCTKAIGESFGTPDSRPYEYEPRYGAFTITINPNEED